MLGLGCGWGWGSALHYLHSDGCSSHECLGHERGEQYHSPLRSVMCVGDVTSEV